MGVRARRKDELAPAEVAIVLQCAALLLGYPDEELLAALPMLTDAVAAVEPRAGAPLIEMAQHLTSTRLDTLQTNYVDTFDLRRRCCLYLTYFSHGDTRKRGMALLRFSHAYRAAGAEFLGGELPDHLAVVCEFAATVDPAAGLRLLMESRVGLELLRRALVETDSAYVRVIVAICAVLPAATQRELDKAVELARTGPPDEEVGLEPYGPPESMGGRR